ncbi:MAG: envelope stress response membrane protein PspB [Rhodospirillaceae bacterium]|nr:envelope stress response membrane protein PspB [Rhodospirillaceae bacterium]
MTAITAIIIAPIIVFLVLVAPVWLLLYYGTRRREANMLSSDHQNILNEMTAVLERMEARLGTLEKILDVEDPRWRDKGPAQDRL